MGAFRGRSLIAPDPVERDDSAPASLVPLPAVIGFRDLLNPGAVWTITRYGSLPLPGADEPC